MVVEGESGKMAFIQIPATNKIQLNCMMYGRVQNFLPTEYENTNAWFYKTVFWDEWRKFKKWLKNNKSIFYAYEK